MFKLDIEPVKNPSTIFGNTSTTDEGYLIVSSCKEGNRAKKLHRLIWEKWYGEIPPTTNIHHKDGNKLNNCIWNLEPMSISEHTILHNSGKPLSEETRLKISETQNNTGYYRVSKHKSKEVKQGFLWRYSYYENSKQMEICSVDLKKLEDKIISRGLPWFKLNGD